MNLKSTFIVSNDSELTSLKVLIYTHTYIYLYIHTYIRCTCGYSIICITWNKRELLVSQNVQLLGTLVHYL